MQWKKEDISIERAKIIVREDPMEKAGPVLEEAGERLKNSNTCGGK
jgi:hypothetical protein